MRTVHDLAEKLSRERLQFAFSAVLQCFLAYVPPDVELRVVFPARQTQPERRGDYTLQISREQWQLRLKKLDAVCQRNLTFKSQDAGHVERHALPLQVQENRVTPGKAISLFLVLHNFSLLTHV